MRPPTIRPFRSAHTRALLVGFLLVPIGAQSTADGAVVGPDVVVSVAPDGPVERGAIATFRIAVRNVGTGRTTSPPVVEIDAQTPEQPTTADGDSWSCTGVAGAPTRCTYARTLGAGESASILQVRRRDARRSDAGVGHVSVAAKVVAGDDGPVYVGGSTAQSPRVSSSLVDLGMTVSATPAGRTGPRRFRVRVRNGDGAATTAPFAVEFPRGSDAPPLEAAGSGWRCDDARATCTHDGILAAGESASPLDVTVTLATPLLDASRDGLTATLTGGGDDGSERGFASAAEDRASTPRLPRSFTDLVTTISAADTNPGADPRYVVRVHAVGPAPSTGPISVRLGRGWGSMIDPTVRAAGAGWICTAADGTCTTVARIDAGATAPPLVVTVPAGAGPPGPALTASVAGGGDDAPDSTSDLDNDRSSITTAAPEARSAGHLDLSIPEPVPLTVGGRPTWQISVRNPTTGSGDPPVVRVDAPFSATARGDGWTCTRALVCRRANAVAPGDDVPPISVSMEVPVSTAIGAATVNAIADSAPGVATSTTTGIGSSVGALDIKLTSDGPLLRGERARLAARVVNPAPVDVAGPVTVALRRLGSASTFTGDGWACTDGESGTTYCTHEGPVPAGGTLPTVDVAFTAPPADTVAVATSASVHAVPGAVRGGGATASLSLPVIGSPADLTITAEGPEPQVGPDLGTALLVVRNRGVRAARGPVSVTATEGRLLGGDGWQCGRRCVHPGPVPVDGALPPLRAEASNPASTGFTSVGISATVSGPDDATTVNSTARATFPAATDARGRQIFASLPRSAQGDRDTTLELPLRVDAPTLTSESVDLAVTAPPGIVVEDITGPDVSCSSSLRCRWARSATAVRTLDATVRVRLLSDAVGPLDLDVRASTGTADVTPGRATTRVVPRGSGADLAIAVGDAIRRPTGATPTPVVVRNGGSADHNGPVAVSFGSTSSSSNGLSPSGAGWVCETNGTSCTHPGPVRAGSVLPEITVRADYIGFAVGGIVPLTPTVEGAEDTVSTNDRAEAAVRVTGAAEADLAASAEPTGRILNGRDAEFVFRVRNVGGRPTTEQVDVDVDAGLTFDPATTTTTIVARGEEWRCSGRDMRCALLRPLAPGEEAPALRAVVSVPAFPDAARSVSRPRAGATLTIRHGEPAGMTSNNVAAAESGAAPTTASDVVTAVNADGPVPPDGPASFSVRVGNVGTETTTAPVEMDLSTFSDEARTVTARGDGWFCPRGSLVCRLDGALEAGATAPDVHVLVIDDVGRRSGEVELRARATGDDGGWTGNNAGSATSVVRKSGAGPRTVTWIQDLRPGTVETRPTASVRVLNAGDAIDPGPIRVDVDARLSDGGTVLAPGWTCAGNRFGGRVCTHDGPLGPGSELPAIVLTGPRPEQGVSSPTTFLAGVTRPGDIPLTDGAVSAATTSPGRAPASLGVSLAGARPSLPGETVRSVATVRNAGATAFGGQVVLNLSHPSAAAISSGDGWTCTEAADRCTRPGPVLPGEELPPVHIDVTTPA